MSRKTKFEVAQSIIDIKPPFIMDEKRSNRFYEELEMHKKYGDELSSIKDSTPAGNYSLGNANNRKAEWVRVVVDNRFLSNERALVILNLIFINIK